MKVLSLLFKLSIFGVIVFASFIFYNNIEYVPGFRTDDKGNPIKHLPYEVWGNPNSKTVLIFLHGFPNTMRMWDEMIQNLQKDFICINISYPNYSEKLHLKWGMDLRDIAFYIPKTVEIAEQEIKIKANESNAEILNRIVISHDWGAFLSYLIDDQHKGFIKQFVTLDVGSGLEESLKAGLFTVTYQWYLAANFVIGNKIGDYFTRLFTKILPKPVYGIAEKELEKINSGMNFFYYQFWKRCIYYVKFTKRYSTETPMSYFYGKTKRFQFHNQKFVEMLKANKDSEVFGLEGGHWFMEKKENMKLILDVIRRRALKIIR